ncbi:MOSC domain-containing protein [Natronolimnobius sp. AArcel1]|uniref:MOSC domain-containing protein n=1 Tax=Natronolimnobius sp. AArcel1 TaxID=1679093 RepID=UPI0013ED6AEB|nr:MOSC N-terminal beta barrel domain-containing protein [Natronolimnobius sp. AArcel1]NGM68507.1 MOSC domain-containing protein [Natronolimnobius sp. AArcel1]
MTHIDRLTVYPVKGLDGIDCEHTSILEGGTLEYDREFALFDADGDVVNGKRTDRIHDLETGFDPETTTLTVAPPDGDSLAFDLESASGRERAADWFGDFFDLEVTLERDRSLGYVDRREMGPSVISTATLREVASWFDDADLTVDSVRRRMRANVEVGGVEPFWEDRFVGDDAPAFEVDGICFEGVTPCGRCVVPQRDPDTGETLEGFRERFIERREATFPEWADEAAFDHYYTLMVIMQIPETDRGDDLAVGDSITIPPA